MLIKIPHRFVKIKKDDYCDCTIYKIEPAPSAELPKAANSEAEQERYEEKYIKMKDENRMADIIKTFAPDIQQF